MSQIANILKVSLRTLYELAPSKEELVLIAVDRLLFKIGKEAQNSIDSNDSPLTQLKKYLNALGYDWGNEGKDEFTNFEILNIFDFISIF